MPATLSRPGAHRAPPGARRRSAGGADPAASPTPGGPRDHPRLPADGRPRRDDREHRAARHPPRPAASPPPACPGCINAYTLTFGGLLLLGARAGDILGRRRMFIAGIALFTLASLVGGLAQSPGWLLAARAVQGVGAAIAAPSALALLTTSSPRAASAPARSASTPPSPAAAAASAWSPAACSPSGSSWRWVLFVNVPIGLALICARAARTCPRPSGSPAASTSPAR